jgi:hypothetical protein
MHKVMIMQQLSSLSTRELMTLVALAACNLVFFQGGWMIIIIPPITMIAAILNLTLYWTWVRRRSLTRAFLASTLTGLAMALTIGMYMAATPLNPPFAMRFLNWLPEWAQRLIPISLLGYREARLLDFAVLDLLGFGSMFAMGWLIAAHDRSRDQRRTRSVGGSS